MKDRWRALTGALVAGALALSMAACSARSDERGEDAPTAGTQELIDAEGRLTKPATIKMTLPVKVQTLLAPFIADALGEFDKRNLDVDIEVVPTTDAIALLATGKIDAVLGGFNVTLLNAISAGSEVRVVAPNSLPEGRGGWWVSTAALNGAPFSPKLLKGQKIGSSQGNLGISMVGLADILDKADLALTDVEIITMGSQDQLIALEQGAIFAGVVSPPNDIAMEASGAAELVGPNISNGWPQNAYMFGPTLLKDRPEVGMAFVSAIEATYARLQGDYLKDPEIKRITLDLLEIDEETLGKLDGAEYPLPLEIPAGLIERIDEVWRVFPGVLSSTKPLGTEQVVDTRFMDFANQKP